MVLQVASIGNSGNADNIGNSDIVVANCGVTIANSGSSGNADNANNNGISGNCW